MFQSFVKSWNLSFQLLDVFLLIRNLIIIILLYFHLVFFRFISIIIKNEKIFTNLISLLKIISLKDKDVFIHLLPWHFSLGLAMAFRMIDSQFAFCKFIQIFNSDNFQN